MSLRKAFRKALYVNPLKLLIYPAFNRRGDGLRDERGGLDSFRKGVGMGKSRLSVFPKSLSIDLTASPRRGIRRA